MIAPNIFPRIEKSNKMLIISLKESSKVCAFKEITIGATPG